MVCVKSVFFWFCIECGGVGGRWPRRNGIYQASMCNNGFNLDT
jgi:hypothetical protein